MTSAFRECLRAPTALIVALIACSAAKAADGNPCQGVEGTLQLVKCFDDAGKGADRDLNQLYARIVAVLGKDEQAALRNAERLWVQFRDATCGAERDMYIGGTAMPVYYTACIYRETRHRVDDLTEIYYVRLPR
jgi:uncharacterized protein YecT (DUF1311 family)